jgi:hypothetical protein
MRRFFATYIRDVIYVATAITTLASLAAFGWAFGSRQARTDMRISGCEKSIESIESKVDKLLDMHLK